MAISYHPTKRGNTHMVVIGITQAEFDLCIPESQIEELIKLFGNDGVDKIRRIMWARQWLKIGLREAKEFVEQASAQS